jgi:hypothetical protein
VSPRSGSEVPGADAALRSVEGAGGGPETARVYRRSLRSEAPAALAALAEVVEEWGGEWTPSEAGGDLLLPARAGLRYGLVRGRARSTPRAGGCELVVEVTQERWALNRAAVVLLVTAGVTSLAGVLWPFYPALGVFAPLGLVLGASAWLAILARLRHQGPAELLADVEAALDERQQPLDPPPPITPR